MSRLSDAYEDLQPRLREIEAALRPHLRTVVARADVKGAVVSSRVKETESFLKKALETSVKKDDWTDPITDCTDKVGCRIDVVYHADVDRLRETIEADERLDVLKVDDKAIELGPDSLGYSGLHIDVFLREYREDSDRCEIQVRTYAQAAWSMASHELSYKGPIGTTDEQRRRLNRLTALVELFDEVVGQVSTEIMDSPDYPLSTLIRRLESLWLTMVGKAYSEDLTAAVITALFSGIDKNEADDLAESVSEFVVTNEARILETVDRFSGDPLLSQPEILLIWYFLENDKYGFVERWDQSGLARKLLDDVAVQLSERLPQPN